MPDIQRRAMAIAAAVDRPDSQPRQQQPARRDALRALLAGLAAVGAGAAASPARASGDSSAAREGEVRHTEQEWREILGPDSYAVMREVRTWIEPLIELRSLPPKLLLLLLMWSVLVMCPSAVQ